MKHSCIYHSPHQILGMSTPEEAFSSKKPDVSYFKNFGSFVYFHVTKYARKKLEPIAEVGIFLEYTDTPHNYRVYLLVHRMTMVRRDVKFDEGKAMQLSLERELELDAVEELLDPKDKPQDVEQRQGVDPRVAETTHADPSTRNGRNHTKEADGLMLDVVENVGAPTSQRRYTRSPDRYIGHVALMSEFIVTEPSYFEE